MLSMLWRPGHNSVTITTTGNAAFSANVDAKMVFGKLINLRSQLFDPRVHRGVVQQEVADLWGSSIGGPTSVQSGRSRIFSRKAYMAASMRECS